jgi:hypothetical protein
MNRFICSGNIVKRLSFDPVPAAKFMFWGLMIMAYFFAFAAPVPTFWVLFISYLFS